MQISSLSNEFYSIYNSVKCPQILEPKNKRPYYILPIDSLIFGIPLHSNVKTGYGITEPDGLMHGLDYIKSVVITDSRFIDTLPHTIDSREFQLFKNHKYDIQGQFDRFVKRYVKETRRRIENPDLPALPYLRCSALQYFHAELGIGACSKTLLPVR